MFRECSNTTQKCANLWYTKRYSGLFTTVITGVLAITVLSAYMIVVRISVYVFDGLVYASFVLLAFGVLAFLLIPMTMIADAIAASVAFVYPNRVLMSSEDEQVRL